MRKSFTLALLAASLFSHAQVTREPTIMDLLTRTSTTLWGACNGCPNIFQMSPSQVPVSGIPETSTHFQDFDNDGTNVWATSTGLIYEISPDRNWTTFPMYSPSLLAIDGTNVWVSSNDTINHIDTQTGAVLSFIKVGSFIQDIKFDNDHNLWVLLYSGTILKYAPAASTYSASIPIGPNSSAIGYDGSTIWVSSPSGITRIDAATNAIVGNYPTVGTRFAFDGHNMWLLTPGGMSRLNNSGIAVDTYLFGAGGNGTDIVLDGTSMRATNSTFMITVPLAALAPLPVKFTWLNSNCTGTSVAIHWNAEGDATKYEVLRSTNGSKWESIGTVAANAVGSYSVVDRNAPNGALYRINEMEANGRNYLSSIMKTSCGLPELYSIYPNPAGNNAILSLFANGSGRGLIRIYDSKGGLVKFQNQEIMKGSNQIPLDLSSLPGGRYQVVTSFEGSLKATSLLKQ